MLSAGFQWIKGRASYTRLTSALTLIVSLCGASFFLKRVDQNYPVAEWLIWPLLHLVVLSVVFYASLVAAGNAALKRIVDVEELPTSERLVHSMVLGLGIFALLMYIVGAIGGYGAWFGFLLPTILFMVGARDLPAWYRSVRLRYERRPRLSVGSKIFSGLAMAFGGYMLALLYLSSFTPASFNFDAIWYHVPIAQDYAREGRIVPFYGDNHRAYPHLASFLHTWALLVPGIKELPLRWMLMLHLELGSVVWRVIGAAAVARWLLNGRIVPGLWAVFFLFPSIFIYDQNVAGSADHVLGMTAASLFLAVGRSMKRLDARYLAVAGVAAGCHILTKYQAIYLVVATAGVVAARVVWLISRRLRKDEEALSWRQLIQGPLLIVVVALVVSSPHFIKNAIYYQNPIYPFAQHFFPSSFDDWERPNVPKPVGAQTRASSSLFGHIGLLGHDVLSLKRSPDATAQDAGEAELGDDADLDSDAGLDGDVGSIKPARRRVKAQATAEPLEDSPEETDWDFRYSSRSFSFLPQGDHFVERFIWVQRTFLDWSFETGNRHLTSKRPYMGSLFTLLLPLLLLLRGTRRLWFGFAFCYLAFFTWGMSNANDRYLLSFLSLLIGMSGALLVRGWHLGLMARIGMIALVAVQLMWGGDAPWVYADKRLDEAADLIKSGYSGRTERRLNYFGSAAALTAAFPEDALILGRYFKANLGFDRAMLNTHRPIQSYIDFRKLKNPRDLWQICKDRGVTHLLYPEGRRKPTVVQEIVLFDALAEISEDRKKVAGNVIVRLSDQPPVQTEKFKVLVKGIKEYQDGLFDVHALKIEDGRKIEAPVRTKRALTSKNVEKLLEKADAVYLRGNSLPGDKDDVLEREFKRVERFGSLNVWLRKVPRHGPAQ